MTCCLCGNPACKQTVDTVSPLCADCWSLLGEPGLPPDQTVLFILTENRWRLPIRAAAQQFQVVEAQRGRRVELHERHNINAALRERL